MTLISEAPMVAFGCAETFTSRRLELITQTRLTKMSWEPKPAVTCPSTKRVLTPLISTMAEAPAGSPESDAEICGTSEAS